jgi:hypothetical protein
VNAKDLEFEAVIIRHPVKRAAVGFAGGNLIGLTIIWF